MKAIKFFKYSSLDVLELKNITLKNLRQGEVLIKNKAIGLNYIDTYNRSGLYPVSLPSHVGMEGSGVVEEIGPNEKFLKKVIELLMPLFLLARMLLIKYFQLKI